MPDGEIFTAPVENSVEGKGCFEFRAIAGGREVAGIRLRFEKGKVVEATAEKNEADLKEMLAADPGACRPGEVGVGGAPGGAAVKAEPGVAPVHRLPTSIRRWVVRPSAVSLETGVLPEPYPAAEIRLSGGGPSVAQ